LNYSGKFDAKVPVDGSDLHSNGHVHVDTFSAHATHAPVDAIVVPDAHLLFNGDFKRSGVDLVLSRDDQELVLHDYFKGEKRAALASPDGAHLTGDIVNALTGHVEYAQADGSVSVGKVIGHVTKLAGTATAVRNGVSVILNQGDNVEKGDVVQSGSGSTLGITFIDGTVFGLSSNARMVLNEMVYDPNGSNNSSLLSLVAGTITFVAGETAKHGDMKIDTPVATMGIRGTAVLVEIDFDVPGQAGLPDAKFQVLVEPDGTTGSYILFDKTTLTPLAVVDKAGQQINISNGTLTLSSTGLSSEIQKLITDVFSIKFSDTNTKTFDHHTDTPIPDSLSPFKIGVITALPIVLQLPTPVNTAPSNSVVLPNPNVHINQAPTAVILNASGQAVTGFQITELPAVTHSSALDTASGKVSFVDINVGDAPTVSTRFDSFTYQNAAHTDVTATLSAQQLADIVAVEAKLAVVPDPGNSYFGSATWTYGVPDGAFDFLAKGETLTLTYDAFVDNNYRPSDLVTELKFTITITGTNDVPVITSPQPNINFVSAGTDTKGGELIPNTATAGKLTFTDPDLTDTHTVAVKMTSALLDGQSFATTVGPVVIDELAAALTAKITTADDTTGTGTGTVEWALANLQVYLADLVPANESLVLTYAVTVTDSQNATSIQDIVVTISGNNGAAVVWTDTNPIPPGGALWSVASNWEGDRTPNSNGFSDDVFIGTDQVLPATPTFPVTVDAMAAAKSLTMNYFTDFGTAIPELDVESTGTLTIAGALNLDTSTDPLSPLTAESIIKNFGNISVGGIATLVKHSVLDNYGTITLAQGGVFGDQSSITNSGTMLTGGTLDVEVAVANSGGTIQVDDGATLALSDATVAGGTINNGTASGTGSPVVFGRIDVTGNSTINGNASLNNGYVMIESGVILTLDNVTVTGTTFTETAGGAILAVDATDTLTLDGVTINGGTVTDNGTVNVDAANKLKLNGVALSGGLITNAGTIEITAKSSIENDTFGNNQLTVDSGVVLTLDGTTITGGTVSNTGATLMVDATTTLTLQGGIIVSGGRLANSGTVKIEASSGATLDGVTVIGSGVIQVDGATSPAVALVLDDGTSITGGTLSIGPVGTVDVEYGSNGPSHGATFDGVAVNNTNGGTFEVGETHVSGTVIALLDDGTTINSGVLTIGSFGAVDVEYGSNGPSHGAIFDGITLNNKNGGMFEIGETSASGTVVTLLDDGTIINGGALTIGSFGAIDIEYGSNDPSHGATFDSATVNNNNGGTFEVGETSASGSVVVLLDDGTTVNGGTLTVGSFGAVDVEYGSNGPSHGATFNGVTVNISSGGTFDVGETQASGTIIAILEGATSINNGTLTVGSAGALEVETAAGATLNDVQVTNHNSIEVVSGSVLTLDGGTNVTNSGATVTVDTGGTLVLNGATITGGTITNAGTIEITGTGSIDSDIFGNHQLTVDSGVILTLDGTTITDGTITDTGTVNIDSGDTLTLGAGAAFNGGTITNAGTLDIEASSGATLSGVNITGTGNMEIDAPAVASGLVLAGGATMTGGTLTVGSVGTLEIGTALGATLNNVRVINNDAIEIFAGSILTLDLDTTIANAGATTTIDGHAKLVLDDATIDGGSINDYNYIPDADDTHGVIDADDIHAGLIDVTGSSKIDSNAVLNQGDLTVESGVTLTLDNVTVNGTTIIVTANGVIQTDSGTTRIGGGSIFNDGTLEVTGAGSALVIDDNVSGTGSLKISGAATLEFVGQDYGERVSFLANSTGTLEIDSKIAPHRTLIFGGEISGVTANNKIDLADLQYTSGASHGDIAVGSLVFNDMTIVIVTNTNTHQSVVLDVAGSHTAWSVTSDGHGGVDIIDPPADSSSLTISSGAMLDIGATSAATVSFLNDSGTNGTLAIDTPSDFSGLISGFTGDGTLAGSDQIDLKGINYSSGLFSETYNPTNETLSVSDGANSTVLHFTGTYQAANFSFQSDGNGGTIVYDPPVSGNPPATSTIAASAPNQTLTGNAVSDTFAFNFANVGNATVTNFHADTDVIQFNSRLFANVQAALNATHDDGHGNTVIALDAHDTITLSGVVKAQLHASDFHFA
jgi:fibronectin-binding autotransporter adhesin